MQRNKAKIRGALSAVTVPTPVANIINKFGIAEQLFFSLADELIKTNRLSGQERNNLPQNQSVQDSANVSIPWMRELALASSGGDHTT